MAERGGIGQSIAENADRGVAAERLEARRGAVAGPRSLNRAKAGSLATRSRACLLSRPQPLHVSMMGDTYLQESGPHPVGPTTPNCAPPDLVLLLHDLNGRSLRQVREDATRAGVELHVTPTMQTEIGRDCLALSERLSDRAVVNRHPKRLGRAPRAGDRVDRRANPEKDEGEAHDTEIRESDNESTRKDQGDRENHADKGSRAPVHTSSLTNGALINGGGRIVNSRTRQVSVPWQH